MICRVLCYTEEERLFVTNYTTQKENIPCELNLCSELQHSRPDRINL